MICEVLASAEVSTAPSSHYARKSRRQSARAVPDA